MKKISQITELMASRLTLMAVVVAMLVAGCKKDSKADLDDLLKTVPAEAGMVVSYNLANIAEKAGCKIDGNTIELPAELATFVGEINDPIFRQRIETLLKGEAGMELSNQVVFAVGNHVYITGLLSDPEKFVAFLSSDDKPIKMDEKEGVKYSSDAAIIGNQFWLIAEGEINPLDIKSMSELAENKTFFSTDYAKRLADDDYTLRGIISTSSPLIGGGNFSKQASQMMLLQMLFSDAAYIDFSVEFEKEKVSMQASVLNSKYKAAGYNFPVAKVKSDVVKSIAGSGSFGFAVEADGKFVEKVEALLSQLGAVGQLYANTISPIDGTVAFVGDMNANESDMKLQGVIKTSGANLNTLTSALDMFGLKWRKDADRIIVNSETTPSGEVTAGVLAKEADGSLLCIVAAGNSLPAELPFSRGVIKLKSVDGGIMLEAKAIPTDTETPVLLSIIKAQL